MPGVIRTRVGYSGGTTRNPTYTSIGDHSETTRIDYDPAKITYEQLLEVFWKRHDPCSPSSSRQYACAIFYHNEEQKKLAEKTRDQEAAKRGKKITTTLAPLGEFTMAEDYHQKYYLKQRADLAKEFTAFYPNANDFINSTAVMRVNAYLDGEGTLEGLEKEIDQYGLSAEGKKKLLQAFKQRKGIR